MTHRITHRIALVFAALAAVGCGGGDAPPTVPAAESVFTVSGKLTKGGQAVTSPAVSVQFLSGPPTDQSYSGRYNPQAGTYEVPGVPAGKFKVAVAVRAADGTGVAAPVTLPTPVEVTADKTFDIDLPR